MKKSRLWLLGVIILCIITTYGCSASTNTTKNKAMDGETRINTKQPSKEEQKKILKEYPDECFDHAKAVAEEARGEEGGVKQ